MKIPFLGDVDLPDVIKGLAGAGSVMQTISAYKGAQQENNALKYQATVDENNAIIAGQLRADAIRNGEIEAVNAGLKTGQLIGKQRAAYSQSGVAIDGGGSPLNVLSDTLFMGRRDASIITDNARKKAWGYDVQAQNDVSNAGMLRDRADANSPWKAGAGALLTSGASVASTWYNLDKQKNKQTLGS